MADETPASRALRAIGIPHSEFYHAGKVSSLEQAARERGQRPEQVVRSLLFRLEADQFVMVLAAGGKQVLWRKLRQHLGQRRLSLATPDEVLHITGFRIGSVAPFGLRRPLPVLADHGVLAETEVSVGSGLAGVGIVIMTADLLRALGSAEVVVLTKAP